VFHKKTDIHSLSQTFSDSEILRFSANSIFKIAHPVYPCAFI